MVNKSSISDLATKADIDRLEKSIKKSATKTELKKTERVLRVEILRVEEKVENVEESQKRVEVKLDKISDQLDGFVGRVDDLTNDNEIGADQIHELRKDVADHEKRLTKLESSN